MREIFVFGSNEAGRHGKGAALHAVRHHGAKLGQGFGLHGESFAIPTKDKDLNVLPLDRIRAYVHVFLIMARISPDLLYNVTQVGCGLAGYVPDQIAPMFKHRTSNVKLPPEFLKVLGEDQSEGSP